MKDLYNEVHAGYLLASTNSAERTSKVLDLAGFNSCFIAFVAGTVGTAGQTTAFSTKPILQEGATTATFTAVGASDLLGSFVSIYRYSAAATKRTDAAVQLAGYKGNKRYLRLVTSATGTATANRTTQIAASAIVGHARNNPPSAPTVS